MLSTLCAGVVAACGSAEPLGPVDTRDMEVLSNSGPERSEPGNVSDMASPPQDGSEEPGSTTDTSTDAGGEDVATDDPTPDPDGMQGNTGAPEPDTSPEQDPEPSNADAFRACFEEDNAGCGQLYVAATLPEDGLCVRLSIDNCGDYSSRGLPADLPFGWRLTSATARNGIEECSLGGFEPGSAPALGARGMVEWPADEPPGDVVLDLVLEFSSRSEVPGELELTGPAAGVSVNACE